MKNLKNKSSFTKKAGEKIEKFGDKVAKNGAVKAGAAISRAGSKLEQNQERRPVDKNKK